MKPSEILLAARELVAAGHCVEAYARTEKGRRIYPKQPSAVCFCTVGALVRATTERGDDRDRMTAEFRFLRRVGWVSPDTHDASTHLENVVRLEKAALLAMSEGQ